MPARSTALRALAERLHAPVVPTQMALGVVPSDSPHFIGHGGLIAGEAVKHAFERADVILSDRLPLLVVDVGRARRRSRAASTG